MSKHTDGPWTSLDYGRQCHINAAHIHIATVLMRHERGSSMYDLDETKANAQLMATAPDLLEALKTIVDCWSVGGTADDFVVRVRDNGFMDAARAAIAKAEPL